MPACTWTARSLMWPTAVIVTLPPLPVICTAAFTISSVTAPGVMIAWSASWPQVVSRTKSCASLAVANACVAPNTLVAMSRLNSTGSTTTTFFEKVPSVQNPPMSVSPSWNRQVPSSNMPVPALRPLTHMLECPVEQGRQAPQAGMYEQTILSPGFTRCTSGPTDSTIPAPSCPPTTGSRIGASPVVMWSSEWHSPAAMILTRTSCAFGSSSWRLVISQPTCGARAMAARVVMVLIFCGFPFLASPRCFRGSVLVDDHAADVLAVEHVLVALVDLIQLVPAGDQLVELE